MPDKPGDMAAPGRDGACADNSVGGVRPLAVTGGQGADSSPGPEPSTKHILAAALRGSRDKREELAVMAFVAALEPKAAGSERAASSPVIPTEDNNDEQHGPLFQGSGGTP